jgi:hypothetical protein
VRIGSFDLHHRATTFLEHGADLLLDGLENSGSFQISRSRRCYRDEAAGNDDEPLPEGALQEQARLDFAPPAELRHLGRACSFKS